MKAVVIQEPGVVVYADHPEPQIDENSVKVRVMACGICGSDVPRVWKSGAHSYPIILGHEFSGYITEVGKNVQNLSIGDHVAGIPLVPCMKCPDCQKGYFSQCRHYSFIGSRQQGAFADYVVIPAQNAFKIDSSIPYRDAALFEPSTVALHGIQLSNFSGGKRVLILGGGTIGCFALQWVKFLGASQIVVIGRNKKHLELSKRLGADYTISTLDSDFYEQLMKCSDEKGFDYIYETAGSTDMMHLAFQTAANQAHICFIGTPTEDLSFSPSMWENMNRKEFHLTGSWMSCTAPFPGHAWEMTQQCIANGNILVDSEMIFKTYPMSDAKEAFDLFKEPGKVKGRVVLTNELN